MKTELLKKHFNTFIVLLAMTFFVSAQNNFTEYNGKVVDYKSGKALSSVSLNVNYSNISTVTNSEGEFVLKVPKAFLDSKVIISSLGYNTRVVPLSEFESNMVINLNEAVTELSAVNINAYTNAEKLVRKVFKEKSENVQNESVYMTAFYRETIKRRNRNVSLTEAVVNILKEPYTNSKRDAIKLSKARKRTDYKRLDTLSVKLQGGPFSTIFLDVMKYPEYIFTDESIVNYEFSFDPPSSINNRNVYVIDFKPKNRYSNILYNGKLYVDVQTLALASANYSLDLSDKNSTRNLLVRKKPGDVNVYPLEANYKVDYKIKGNKWYYSYSNLSLEFKVDKKRELFNKVYTLNSEMAVTDWEITTTDTKIRNRDKLRPSVIITDAISGFSDPDFWGEYNLIEPDKSIESAIEKIQKNIEKQKEQASKANQNGMP